MDKSKAVEDAVEQVLELEAEREVSGVASTGGASLEYARAALHTWVDTVVGVAAAAGSGRVTLIHANGKTSGIASPELAYLVTPPINWDRG